MTKLYKILLLLLAFGAFSFQANASIRWIADSDLDSFSSDGNSYEYGCNPSIFNKTCSDPNMEGKGISCDGKFKECKCKEEFKYEIDADCPNSNEVVDTSSASCTLDNGKTFYSACKCAPKYTLNCDYDVHVPTTDVCGGFASECRCPSEWEPCKTPHTSTGKICRGKVGNPDGTTTTFAPVDEICECPLEYLICKNGPDIPGTTPSCTEKDGVIKYKECKPDEPAMTCEDAIVAAYPSATLISDENDLPSSIFGGTMILINNINTTKNLPITSGAKIKAAQDLTSFCTGSAAKLKIGNLQVEFIENTNPPAVELDVELTANAMKIKNTMAANTRYYALINMSKSITFNTIDDTTKYINLSFVNKGENGKLFILGDVETNGIVTLHNVYFAGNFTHTKHALSSSSLNLRGKGKIGGNLKYNGRLEFLGPNLHYEIGGRVDALDDSFSFSIRNTGTDYSNTLVEVNTNGTEDIGIKMHEEDNLSVDTAILNMNNSKIDMSLDSSKIKDAFPSWRILPFAIIVKDGGKILDVDAIKYGNNPLFMIYFLNRKTSNASEIVMSNGSIIKIDDTSTFAYARLANKILLDQSSGHSTVIFHSEVEPIPSDAIITTFDGNAFCEAKGYCYNLVGHSNTCEFPYDAPPEYTYHREDPKGTGAIGKWPRVVKRGDNVAGITDFFTVPYQCQTCTRNGKTYYGGRCIVNKTCSELLDMALQKCLDSRTVGDPLDTEKRQFCNDMYAPGGEKYTFIENLCKMEKMFCSLSLKNEGMVQDASAQFAHFSYSQAHYRDKINNPNASGASAMTYIITALKWCKTPAEITEFNDAWDYTFGTPWIVPDSLK